VVTQTPFESNTARTMERLANQALDRSINRPATVTINQGTVVNIYVARDVDFSAVLKHPSGTP
jgi:type IV secretion system protein VirB10